MNFLNVLVSGILIGGIYALVAIGLNLVFGVVRVVNFAHGEFVMLGMYAAYFAYQTSAIDPYLAVFIIAPLAFLLGVVVQRLVIQPLLDEPLMQIFATFGLVIVFENAVLAITRGQVKSLRTSTSDSKLDIGGVIVSTPRLVVFVVASVLAVLLVIFLRRSTYGTAMRAVSQDRSTARLMGIDVNRVYLVTSGVATALAFIAGVLIVPLFSLTPAVGLDFILPAFAVVVLGGLGSIAGSYIGGMIVGIVETMSGFYLDPALKKAFWFTLFVIVLVVRPHGLLGQRGAEEYDQE